MAWKDGESGNLLGRPRVGASLANALRLRFPPERIADVVEELLNSEDERVRVVTVQFIAERGYGKPPPSTDDGGGLTQEHASLVHALGSTPHQRRLAADSEADDAAMSEVVDAIDA